MNRVFIVCGVMLTVFLAGCGGKGKEAPATTQALGPGAHDKRFLREAAAVNLYQVEAGRIAVAKAKTDRVRNVARLLLKDHDELGGKLEQLAGQHHIALRTDVDPEYASLLARFDALQGLDLEREYLNQQIKIHRDAEQAYGREADRGEDPGIRAFAQEHLPEILEHQRHIEQLRPGTWRAAAKPTGDGKPAGTK